MGVGFFGGGDNLLLGGVRAAVGDVVPDGGRAQPGVLEDHAVALPERLAGKMTDIMAVDRDRTLPDVVEPHQQVNERRLAAAGRADNRDPLAGMDREVQAFNQRDVGRIGEADVRNPDFPLRMGKGDRVFRLGDLRLLVQKGEDASGRDD